MRWRVIFITRASQGQASLVHANLKGLFIKFSKFNPRLYGSNGFRIWSFKKFHRRIRSQMLKIGCAWAVRLHERAISLVFAQSAIPIYTQGRHIKGAPYFRHLWPYPTVKFFKTSDSKSITPIKPRIEFWKLRYSPIKQCIWGMYLAIRKEMKDFFFLFNNGFLIGS